MIYAPGFPDSGQIENSSNLGELSGNVSELGIKEGFIAKDHYGHICVLAWKTLGSFLWFVKKGQW